MSKWRELFVWLKESGSPAKIAQLAVLNSLWFLALYSLWLSGFFLSWKSFLELFRPLWGWVVFLMVLVLPGANLLVLGYYKRLARELMTRSSDSLPALKNPVDLFRLGAEMIGLLMLVFSPSGLSLIVAAGIFSSLIHGDAFSSFGRFLLIVFLLILAPLFLLFSWAAFPVCFLRELEGENLSWALNLDGLWKDLMALGFPFFVVFISLTGMGLIAGGILSLLCVLLAVSPVGGFVSGSLFILVSSAVCSVLIITGIRYGVESFRALHYNY